MRLWHRISSVTGKILELPEDPGQRAAVGLAQLPQWLVVGERPREEGLCEGWRPRPCSRRWRARAEASQLPGGGHLEKSSTLRCVQYLLPTGPGRTQKGGVTYNRDGKYHSCGGHSNQHVGTAWSPVVRILGAVGKDTRIN